MSKLEELIRELCPDGVEYKRLGDICSIKARIGWQRLNKSEYLATGDYYLVTGVDIRPNNRVDFSSCHYVSEDRYKMDENIQLENNDIILTKDGTIGKVAIIEGMDKPAVLNSHLFVIRDTTNSLEAKFLLYVLLSKSFTKFVGLNKTQGTIPGLNQATVVKFEVPVPPLPVQREIVRILDNLSELMAELTAELTARKKQYEYYRDLLLTFDDVSQTRPDPTRPDPTRPDPTRPDPINYSIHSPHCQVDDVKCCRHNDSRRVRHSKRNERRRYSCYPWRSGASVLLR